MPYENSLLTRLKIARGELPADAALWDSYQPKSALERLKLTEMAKDMGPFAPTQIQIPPQMKAPLPPTVEGRGGYMLEESSQPAPAAQKTGNPVLDMFSPQGAPVPPMGMALGNPGQTFHGAAAPEIETQIKNINNQTMQAATGKAQESESMSDLGKMVQAYFGGRTQEQKQKEAFMNIAAGLAAGKSPRFMDNLGNAVSGAITYGRDDDNRREKEALGFGIQNQELNDKRSNNEMDNNIQKEKNAILRDSLEQRSSTAAQSDGPNAAFLNMRFRQNEKAIQEAQAGIRNLSPLEIDNLLQEQEDIKAAMAGGVFSNSRERQPSSSPAYSRPVIKMGTDAKAIIVNPQ